MSVLFFGPYVIPPALLLILVLDALQHKALLRELVQINDRRIRATISVEDTSLMLREAVAKLEVSNDDLRKFTSLAAHQLRSPPRTIYGLAQALREDWPTPDIAYLDDIILEANNMTRTVDGLYRLSKIRDSGSQDTQTTSACDLNLVLQGVIKTLQRDPEVQLTTATVEIHGPLPTVYVPTSMVDLIPEIFLDLIKNAIKFNRNPPELKRVTIYAPGSSRCPRPCGRTADTCPSMPMPCILVQDNGIGIDRTYEHKLFQMFERLHPDLTDIPGTGVGLAMIKAILHRLGGDIRLAASSTAPREGGTTFCVTLPLKPPT